METVYQAAICEENLQHDETIFNYFNLDASLSKHRGYSEFQLVKPQLYLGNLFSTLDVRNLVEHKIAKVIRINQDTNCYKIGNTTH